MIDLLDKIMWNYIIKDIGKELEYLPYAILLGLILFFITKIILFKSVSLNFALTSSLLSNSFKNL